MTRDKENDHTYVTFKADEFRKKEFADLGLNLVELGENKEVVVQYFRDNADIVHCQNSGGPEPGPNMAVEAEKPFIVTCQSPSIPSKLPPTGYNILVSAGIPYKWNVPDVRYHKVIYSCAEPILKMNKSECKAYFGLDPNKLTIGRLGRLESIKRPYDFIQTVKELIPLGVDVNYVLFGNGSDHNNIRNEIQKYNLPIVMSDYIYGEDKNKAYNAIDIFLYPTTEEGFGIVFAEAMSIGLPIVTYSDPVTIDVVKHAGVYAIDNMFTTTETPYKSLGFLTKDLIQNDRERLTLSERSETLYNEMYRPERLVKEYQDLYKEIINGR
jgi:glycosyltransferase involved in cell wall biosynthesis